MTESVSDEKIEVEDLFSTPQSIPINGKETFFEVAVQAPLPYTLTYKSTLTDNIKVGTAVEVQLGVGNRVCLGHVISILSDKPQTKFEIKSISKVVDDLPSLSEGYTKWLEWLSKYYIHPIGQVFQLSMPPLLKKNTNRKTRKSDLTPHHTEAMPKPELSEEQKRCIDEINALNGFRTHLVYGVTGSGKTEIYLRLLEDVINRGEQGVVLVPEISLTPQLIKRFVARFGPLVAVYHSQLTDRERTNQWWEMVEQKKKILIGARSALFCPIPKLGVIILDEEHEPSFKQEETFKYHARDAAVVLARQLNIPVILGSATPSLESWHNAITKKYHLHRLEKRVENRPMPTVTIVDLKQKSEKYMSEDSPFWLTPLLEEKISERLKNREQCALFLNRRGFAQSVLCPGCGATEQCPNCSVSLTLHNKINLVCHYCNFTKILSQLCTTCKQDEPKVIGLGTERLEEDLKKLFPDAIVERADRDSVTNREDLEDLIARVEKGDVDILIGTQMIAKGLDFEKMTLVGMVLADVGFNLPDFRASERSFQLLAQMAGRAGRHRPGEVIIQTYNPEHSSVTYSSKHDYEGFITQELEARKTWMYPPYGRILSIRIQSNVLSKVKNCCYELRDRIERLQRVNPQYAQIEVLGPVEAPLAKLNGKYRYHIMLKGLQFNVLASLCSRSIDHKWPGVRLQVDVDPINML